MPLFRALAKNMAASYFGKKARYGFVMEVTLLYVFIQGQFVKRSAHAVSRSVMALW
jgi:hypothetical protein